MAATKVYPHFCDTREAPPFYLSVVSQWSFPTSLAEKKLGGDVMRMNVGASGLQFVVAWVTIKTRYKHGRPRTMQRTKKAAAAIYGWDRPLLTFTYPGFDCGSHVNTVNHSTHNIIRLFTIAHLTHTHTNAPKPQQRRERNHDHDHHNNNKNKQDNKNYKQKNTKEQPQPQKQEQQS